MKNKLTVLSLIGNVMLTVLWLRAVTLGERAGEESLESEAPSVPSAPGQQASSRTLELHMALSKAGLAPELVTRLVVLDAIERNRSHEPAAYWQAEPVRVATLQRQQAHVAGQLRDELIQVYGPDLTESVAAQPLFVPLQDSFPFLTSDKQLQLQALALDEQEKILGLAKSGPLPADPRLSVALFQRVLPEAAKLLSSEELAEMRLRVSNVAEKLRRSGFDFTEAEFRRAYAALASRTAPEGLQVAVSFESDRKMRQALGEHAMRSTPASPIRSITG